GAESLPRKANRTAGGLLLFALPQQERLLIAGIDDVDQVPLVVGGFAELVGDGAVQHLGDREDVDPVFVLALDGGIDARHDGGRGGAGRGFLGGLLRLLVGFGGNDDRLRLFL